MADGERTCVIAARKAGLVMPKGISEMRKAVAVVLGVVESVIAGLVVGGGASPLGGRGVTTGVAG